VNLLLERTKALLKAQDIELVVDISVVKELARVSYDPEFGARPIRRAIQRELENKLSESLLDGKFNSGDTVKVSFKDGAYLFEKV
jgi:ATP-dependent Clp protease ATP-binding subunit ClpA